MIEYGLNDTIKIKRKKLYEYFTHLHPLILIFQTILMPKAILAKFLSQNAGQLEHSYLEYALVNQDIKELTKMLVYSSRHQGLNLT